MKPIQIQFANERANFPKGTKNKRATVTPLNGDEQYVDKKHNSIRVSKTSARRSEPHPRGLDFRGYPRETGDRAMSNTLLSDVEIRSFLQPKSGEIQDDSGERQAKLLVKLHDILQAHGIERFSDPRIPQDVRKLFLRLSDFDTIVHVDESSMDRLLEFVNDQ